jgi:hypothetical protein
MSADHDDGTPEGRASTRRFSVDDARQKAQEAIRSSEFILSRAWDLLRKPSAEWEQIRREETTIPNILIGYVAPLAAIPPICDLIGKSIFGQQFEEAVVRPTLSGGLSSALATWIVTVALVGALGIVVNTLAENFDGDGNDLAAQKVAAYSLTPAFLSGVFSLWPPLWWLSLFPLAASAFLIYRGLPILMKSPPERAVGYAATVAIVGLVAGIILFSLSGCVTMSV